MGKKGKKYCGTAAKNQKWKKCGKFQVANIYMTVSKLSWGCKASQSCEPWLGSGDRGGHVLGVRQLKTTKKADRWSSWQISNQRGSPHRWCGMTAFHQASWTTWDQVWAESRRVWLYAHRIVVCTTGRTLRALCGNLRTLFSTPGFSFFFSKRAFFVFNPEYIRSSWYLSLGLFVTVVKCC